MQKLSEQVSMYNVRNFNKAVNSYINVVLMKWKRTKRIMFKNYV